MNWFKNNPIARVVLTSLGFSAFAAGCDTRPDHEPLVALLEERGFFANFTAAESEAAKADVRSNGWGAVYGENPRFYFADSESLAEGGVADFLNKLKPYLERLGASFTITDNWGDHDYTVMLNGQEQLIWSLAELKRERDSKSDVTWGVSTVRTFEMVNALLEAIGAKERLYAVNGGNDLAAIFLTPDLKELVCESSGFRRVDLPYTPDTDADWNGQPH